MSGGGLPPQNSIRRQHNVAMRPVILDDSERAHSPVDSVLATSSIIPELDGDWPIIDAAQNIFSALESLGCFSREHLQDLKFPPQDMDLSRILKQSVPKSQKFMAAIAAGLLFPNKDYNAEYLFDQPKCESDDINYALRGIVYRAMLRRPRNSDGKLEIPRMWEDIFIETSRDINRDVCRDWIQKGRISPSEAFQFLQSSSEVLGKENTVVPSDTFDQKLSKFRDVFVLNVASWRSVLSRVGWFCIRPRMALLLRFLMTYAVNIIVLAIFEQLDDNSIESIGAVNATIGVYLLYVYAYLERAGVRGMSLLIAMSRYETPADCIDCRQTDEVLERLGTVPSFRVMHILPMFFCFFFAGFTTDLSMIGLVFFWICYRSYR